MVTTHGGTGYHTIEEIKSMCEWEEVRINKEDYGYESRWDTEWDVPMNITRPSQVSNKRPVNAPIAGRNY